MYAEWPFFATLLDNVQLSLAKADMHIAAMYAGLVPDRGLAGRIFGLVRAEYERTERALLAATGQSRLLEREPALERSIDLDAMDRERLTRAILLTINAIAGGLRNTG